MSETNSNKNEKKQSTDGLLDKFLDVLYVHHDKLVIGTALILVYSIFTGSIPIDLDINPFYMALAQYALLGIIVVGFVGDTILDKLVNIEYYYLIVMNLDNSAPPSIYKLGSEAFSEVLRKSEKNLYGDGKVRTAKSFDPDTMVAEGVWIEELSDEQLIKYRTKLGEAVDTLQDEWTSGIAKDETAKSALIRGQANIIRQFSNNLLQSTSMSGADLKEAFDQTVEDANITDITDELEQIQEDMGEDADIGNDSE